MTTGRHSRADRLNTTHIGVWSTSSQDYVVLATELYGYSRREATQHRGNASAFAFAGIPLLFSALRALLIECNSGVYGVEVNHAALGRLARDPNEIALLRDAYAIGTKTIDQLGLVYEVRNEIVHPSHRPSGTPDSTPDYIRPLKALGVLETTGDPRSDYPWMFQIQSHRLFEFTFTLIEQVATAILEMHGADDPHFQCPNLPTYAQYKLTDP